VRATTYLTHPLERNFEIGRFLHLKSEIRNRKSDGPEHVTKVRFEFSDFGFEVQESSDFKFLLAGVLDVTML
jgi:hypothetical protein